MSNYWQRRDEELKHIQAQFQTDADYNRELRRIYDSGQREIQKEVDSFLQNYAGRENLSMDEAIKKVDKMDVEAFRDKAKRYVEEKNFSPRANDELRAYNVKMRMNRQQLLNEHIRLETIAMANGEERLLTARLDDEVYKEMQRQAGILGETVPSPERIRELSKQIVAADFKGTNFSNRIWSDQTDLHERIETAMRQTIIRGENPRVAARNLSGLVSDNVSNARHKAERLAITESARIQTQSQKASFDEYGIQQVEWVAEPDACDICEEQDGKIFDKSQMESDLSIPAHPQCRCSFAAVVDRDAWDADLRARGLTPDDGDGQVIESGRTQEEEIEYRSERLKNRGVNIEDGTFDKFDKRLAAENLEQLDKLMNDFPIVEEYAKNHDFTITSVNNKKSHATVSTPIVKKDFMELEYNAKYFSSADGVIDNYLKNSEKGWSMKAARGNESVYTTRHEFGHIIMNAIDRKTLTDNPSLLTKFQDKQKGRNVAAIKRGTKTWSNSFGKKHYRAIEKEFLKDNPDDLMSRYISDYGMTKTDEAFAEMFANSQLGAPNKAGEAMLKYLEKVLK